MSNICLITIFKKFDQELISTIKSIEKQKLMPSIFILVGHVDKKEELELQNILKFFINQKVKIFKILNEDKSLFNAMNLGIDKLVTYSKNKHFLFLNSGDLLFDESSIYNLDLLSKKNGDKSIATQAILTKNNLKFIRPGKFNDKVINWPHQGFLAPIFNDNKIIYFNEKKIISADRNWMFEVSQKHKIVFSPLVSTIHNLEGISSKLSFKGIKFHYLDSGILKTIKYVCKYFLNFFLSSDLIFILIYKLRGYIRIK